MIVDEKTWIISDTHFGHANIITYCDRPKLHDMMMLKNWMRLVSKDDVVLHLGDVTIWYQSHLIWAKIVKNLPGKKYLIMGNHDKHWTPDEWTNKWDFEVIKPFLQNKIFFSHEPQTEGDWEVNVHGHSHNHAPFRYYAGLGAFYYNVSIEGMGYKPVRMESILKEIDKNQIKF